MAYFEDDLIVFIEAYLNLMARPMAAAAGKG
jgi:hypothetical protein